MIEPAASMVPDMLAAFPDIDRRRANDVRVLVVTGYGLNCEDESAAAFAMVGARPDKVHFSVIAQEGGKCLRDYHVLVIGGGFSFGDHVAGGRVLANRLRFRLGEALARFVDDKGLVLGICNGFQVLVRLGLLPGLSVSDRAGSGVQPQPPTATFVANAQRGYRDAWIRLGAEPASPCVFTRGIATFDCPIRHGEGRLVMGDAAIAEAIEAAHLVPLRYVDAQGRPASDWPENPNGSPMARAALCDPTGRIFGLMPHPEAYLYPDNHPRWRVQQARGELPHFGLGLRIFANAVRAVITPRDVAC